MIMTLLSLISMNSFGLSQDRARAVITIAFLSDWNQCNSSIYLSWAHGSLDAGCHMPYTKACTDKAFIKNFVETIVLSHLE